MGPSGARPALQQPHHRKGTTPRKGIIQILLSWTPFSHKPQGPLLIVQFLAQSGSAHGRTPRQARGAAPTGGRKARPGSPRPFTSRFLQNLRQLAPDPHLSRSGPPAPPPKPQQINIPVTNAKIKFEMGPLGLEARCRSPPQHLLWLLAHRASNQASPRDVPKT